MKGVISQASTQVFHLDDKSKPVTFYLSNTITNKENCFAPDDSYQVEGIENATSCRIKFTATEQSFTAPVVDSKKVSFVIPADFWIVKNYFNLYVTINNIETLLVKGIIY